MLLLSASILRVRQRHLYGVGESLRRCGSCGLVGQSGGGGGGRDGAVFEGHLVFVSVALSTLESVGTYHAVEGLLGGARVFAVLEDHLETSSAKHFIRWELRILTMPSKGFLLGWESDIVLDGDGVCVGMRWYAFARDGYEHEGVGMGT